MRGFGDRRSRHAGIPHKLPRGASSFSLRACRSCHIKEEAFTKATSLLLSFLMRRTYVRLHSYLFSPTGMVLDVVPAWALRRLSFCCTRSLARGGMLVSSHACDRVQMQPFRVCETHQATFFPSPDVHSLTGLRRLQLVLARQRSTFSRSATGEPRIPQNSRRPSSVTTSFPGDTPSYIILAFLSMPAIIPA
jgi:hypothetical protein